jgi:hypothetical protein
VELLPVVWASKHKCHIAAPEDYSWKANLDLFGSQRAIGFKSWKHHFGEFPFWYHLGKMAMQHISVVLLAELAELMDSFLKWNTTLPTIDEIHRASLQNQRTFQWDTELVTIEELFRAPLDNHLRACGNQQDSPVAHQLLQWLAPLVTVQLLQWPASTVANQLGPTNHSPMSGPAGPGQY